MMIYVIHRHVAQMLNVTMGNVAVFQNFLGIHIVVVGQSVYKVPTANVTNLALIINVQILA